MRQEGGWPGPTTEGARSPEMLTASTRSRPDLGMESAGRGHPPWKRGNGAGLCGGQGSLLLPSSLDPAEPLPVGSGQQTDKKATEVSRMKLVLIPGGQKGKLALVQRGAQCSRVAVGQHPGTTSETLGKGNRDHGNWLLASKASPYPAQGGLTALAPAVQVEEHQHGQKMKMLDVHLVSSVSWALPKF